MTKTHSEARIETCPLCDKKFISIFEEKEIKQKGRNMFCPHCAELLWIPLCGKPHPVIQKARIPSSKTPIIPLDENYYILTSRSRKKNK